MREIALDFRASGNRLEYCAATADVRFCSAAEGPASSPVA